MTEELSHSHSHTHSPFRAIGVKTPDSEEVIISHSFTVLSVLTVLSEPSEPRQRIFSRSGRVNMFFLSAN